MRLVWRIVRKDLRQLAWPLVAWAALLTARFVAAQQLFAADSGDASSLDNWIQVNTALKVVELIFAALLAAQLVHQDPVCGTTAWWATRPIGGAQLLIAKLVTLAIMLLGIPLLTSLPWGLAWSDGFAWWPEAAVRSCGALALGGAVSLPFAVLTTNLRTCMFWMLGTAVAIAATGAAIAALAKPSSIVVAPELASTRAFAGTALFAAATAVTVCHQFLTRRTRRTLALAGIGAALVVAGWRSPLTFDWNRESSRMNGDQDEAQWIPVSAVLHPRKTGQAPAGGASLTYTADIRGLPSHLDWECDRVALQFPGSAPVWLRAFTTLRVTKASSEVVSPDRGHLVAQQALGISVPSVETTRMTVSVDLPAEMAQRIRERPEEVRLEFRCVAWRAEALANLPVAENTNASFPGGALRIVEVAELPTERRVTVAIRELPHQQEFSPRVFRPRFFWMTETGRARLPAGWRTAHFSVGGTRFEFTTLTLRTAPGDPRPLERGGRLGVVRCIREIAFRHEIPVGDFRLGEQLSSEGPR